MRKFVPPPINQRHSVDTLSINWSGAYINVKDHPVPNRHKMSVRWRKKPSRKATMIAFSKSLYREPYSIILTRRLNKKFFKKREKQDRRDAHQFRLAERKIKTDELAIALELVRNNPYAFLLSKDQFKNIMMHKKYNLIYFTHEFTSKMLVHYSTVFSVRPDEVWNRLFEKCSPFVVFTDDFEKVNFVIRYGMDFSGLATEEVLRIRFDIATSDIWRKLPAVVQLCA